ncbi:MAG: helicase-exonuclease AddAB subunit AddA [Clostridia bacterium]|nr:helicase-exonuclease AddAB subunit AddA [Clostridia bacterium]
MQLQLGSGKTAVLVERIINKVINDKVDIDKILIVTFTSAAASEMRERILEAIYKKIEEDPSNTDLQRQIILLNKANISTIHSFCLDVIRNNFYEIDASANFRVADSAEVELLKQEIIDDLFEEKYVSEDKSFEKLLNIYTNYRGDENLRQLILNIYRFIQSSPFPEKWLNDQVEKFNLKDKLENDFSETKWGEILLENFKEELIDSILKLKQVQKNLARFEELAKYQAVIENDIANLENLENNSNLWESAYNSAITLAWAKWPSDRKITLEIKDQAKDIRDSVKKKVASTIDKYLIYNSKQANSDIYEMYDALSSIKELVIEFTNKFAAKKKEKNIVDFNDIEHFALNILVKIDENGEITETDVAKKYKEKFEEIAIDEYQDSNLVQENILKSVSKGNNIFMVGDVKQSIYKFRQARPELFLEKYKKYNVKGEEIDKGLKIQLFKNFRSRENILDLTNLIFENIMSEKLGDICYNENEYLNYGANYPEPEGVPGEYAGIAELNIIDLKAPEIDIYKDEDDAQSEEEQVPESEERVEDVVLEAKYVAKKIKELIDSDYIVYDRKKGYRKITYKDIVVLLRSTKISAPIFEKEISNLNMPVFSDISSEYLESMEIQTIMCLLKVIDNPMQDIPLVTVLRSSIGGFTDNELVEIRGNEKNISFYESLKNKYESLNGVTDDKLNDLKDKIEIFLNNLKKWQNEEKYMALDELIWQIYSDTNFYNYVTLLPNGGLRQANLKILFERAKQYESASFKGLFNFINFIDKLHSNSGDLSAAKLIGENEDVIRIMSIHKSKGLEFPVVFLSCTGKQFNLQDLNENIILHQDLGFGPKYINSDMRIEYTTLAKEAIRLKTKVETLSEEMRVLYVALTRAKEKLIITGISKDVQKSLKEKEDLIQMYKNDCNEINHVLLKKYKSYLDWIELVYFNNIEKINDYMNVNIIKKTDLIKELNQDEIVDEEENLITKLNKRANELDKENIRELSKSLKWKYNYIESSVIPTKTSVTKLKEAENEKIISIEELEGQSEESKFAVARPQFLNEDVQITSAQKGTLMHLCFQKLDEHKEYTKEMIQKLVDDLVYRKIITKLEAEAINTYKLYSYTKSELFKQLKNAKKVYKEQPFYISLKADEVYGNDAKDNILVQGIIDLYFINQDDEVVLVDYKTDYVEKGKEDELVKKYEKQLEIYKKALEQALEKNVDKCYIYSVYLEKLIAIL